jgi:hypothetical protein
MNRFTIISAAVLPGTHFELGAQRIDVAEETARCLSLAHPQGEVEVWCGLRTVTRFVGGQRVGTGD